MSHTFDKCLVYLINVSNIYKMSDTFDKSFKHLLIVSYTFEMFLIKIPWKFSEAFIFLQGAEISRAYDMFVIFQACAWFQSAYNLA